jgi:hypothetical protein
MSIGVTVTGTSGTPVTVSPGSGDTLGLAAQIGALLNTIGASGLSISSVTGALQPIQGGEADRNPLVRSGRV